MRLWTLAHLVRILSPLAKASASKADEAKKKAAAAAAQEKKVVSFLDSLRSNRPFLLSQTQKAMEDDGLTLTDPIKLDFVTAMLDHFKANKVVLELCILRFSHCVFLVLL